jgi:polysaccharide pyruvyl transferase WcaK-like protein
MITRAARLATHRSYRDDHSRHALAAMGVDTSRDVVCPDLAFALPSPTAAAGDTAPAEHHTVGLGVMDYHGGNEDRDRAEEVHARYVDVVIGFARWLVDNGYRIRVLTGDRADEPLAGRVVAATRAHRPDLAESWITTGPITTLHELMVAIADVDTVVATRYHNIVCALKLAKPTVSLGYAAKNEVLMAAMGLGGYCQHLRSLDLELLVAQFVELRHEGDDLPAVLRKRSAANAALLEEHLAVVAGGLPRQ